MSFFSARKRRPNIPPTAHCPIYFAQHTISLPKTQHIALPESHMGQGNNICVTLVRSVLLITLIISFLHLASAATEASRSSTSTTSLVVPIHKDGPTGLVVARFLAKTPLKPFDLVVDLAARSLWANCETGYTSSTLKQPKCGSAACKAANTSYCFNCGGPGSTRAFCHTNTCGLWIENPAVRRLTTIGEVAQDVLAAYSTAGSSTGPVVKVPDFLFTCVPSDLVALGLPKGAVGIAGMTQAPIAIQNQLASSSRLVKMFAMCLPSGSGSGPLFFGNGPYNLQQGPAGSNLDVSQLMKYTPLSISDFSEYYIQVKSVKINSKAVPSLNTSLLEVNQMGVGGTTISTTEPYTILHGSLYKSIVSFYGEQLKGVPRVKPVSPFKLCFDASKFSSTRLGPGSPSIDLELAAAGSTIGKKKKNNNKKKLGTTTWNIFGANALVEARPGALCLAFVDGGTNYRASITIGTYQMQDNMVQVDIANSRLGFTGLLYGLTTTCANFNFPTTTTATT